MSATWIESPWSVALGWTLIHSLWEGVIIAAGLKSVLIATRSPRVRYAAGCVAMVTMLATFGITLFHVLPPEIQRTGVVALHPFIPLDLHAGNGSPGALTRDFKHAVPYLSPFWIAGVCFFYIWQAAGWLSARRLRRSGGFAAPDRWRQELARLRTRLGVSRAVWLMESCLVEAPVVLGHVRPVILMPLGVLAGLPAEHIEAILLHELAHIRRCDYLVNLLQRSIEGILFYHPVVWWMAHVIRAERENCCDDVAVAMSGNAGEYAAALASLELNRGSIGQPAVAATGGNLMKRIRRLLYPEQPAGLPAPVFASVLVLASAAVALAAWQADSPAPTPAPQQENAARRPSPYRNWLNEDVAYIITDEERAAFKRLPTNEEREKFIEQFWLRRDPTPGTDLNEFKAEHYRRIAYANEHYGAQIAGWKTDRGRIYIQYGPPDEKETHPGNASGKPADEQWLYRHLPGIGNNVVVEFVDPSGNGEFRQTVDPNDPNAVRLLQPPRR